MKNLYSRLALITSTLLTLGYLIVSAAWVPMTNDATTGTQFTATIWNTLVGNVNDLNSRIGGIISSQWTASGTTISYTGGNVGIGTANPQTKLHLHGTDINQVALMVGSFSSRDIGYLGNLQIGTLDLDGTTWSEKLRVDTNGNVGIGTANPGALLDIEGLGNIVNAKIYTTDNVLDSTATLTFGTTPGARTKAQVAMVNTSIGNSGGALVFKTSGATTLTERMRIDSSGNIGIGTTDPVGKLDVVTTGANQVVNFIATWANTSYISVGNSATGTTGRAMIGFDNSVAIPYGYWQNASGAPLSFQAAAGNVGIGTSSPNKLLHLKTTTGTNAELNIQSGTKPLWGIYHDETSEELRFWNGSNKVVFGSGGNVGIGTTSPLEKLHLFSDITSGQLSPYMEVEETHPTNFATRYLTKYGTYNINTTLPSGTSAGLNLTVAGGDQTSGGGGISLKTNGANTRMFIRQDGKVGIGTTSPSAPLTISGPNESWRGQLMIRDTTTGPNADAYMSFWSGDENGSGNTGLLWYMGFVSDSDNSLSIGTYPNTGHLLLNQWGGNVGIGTTSPTSKLHLLNAGTSDPSLIHGAAAMVALAPGSGTELVIGGMVGSPYTAWIQHRHQTNDGSSYNLALQPSGGNVGIGTTSPWYRLTVVGPANDWTIVANPSNSQPYGLLSYGTTWAGYFIGPGYINQAAWSYGSDRRLKENIVYINNGLEKVLQLKPVAYDYISGTKNNLGFIAQDVQRVIPEAVSITDPKTGMLGLKTEFIIPYLVNATKEQQNQIEELRKENNSLKSLVCLDHPSAEICQ